MGVMGNPLLLAAEKLRWEGDIISLDAGFTVGIEPVQDLHGYDYPWPAGSGKNKLPTTPTSTIISTVSLVIDDLGIATINGTAGSSLITFGYAGANSMSQVSPGNYYFTAGLSTAGSSTTWDAGVWDSTASQYAKKWNGTAGGVSYSNTFIECKIEEGHSYTVLLHLRANATANQLVFKPMLCYSTETDTTWEPYANICPITGWTGAKLWNEVEYDPTANPKLIISWQTEAGTVYGGTLDVLTGDLKARPYYASYAGETLVGPWISDRDAYAPNATPTTGAQVVDLGGEETVYQLTPAALSLLDTNNIWADCGPVQLTIRK